jgi:hypothetical protein
VDPSTNPKYEFSRLSKVDQNFRDDVLPADKQLSRKLSIEDGGFETVDLRPRYFHEEKTTGVLCNHDLSQLYFACYLWHYVFYDLLTDEQQIVWNNKNPQKILEIEITVGELHEEVDSKHIPGRGARREWIERTLEFLTVVDVADRTAEEEYCIGFRNLQDRRREHKDVVTQRSDLADLAYIFASWYCEGVLDMDRTERSQLHTDTEVVDLDEDLTQPELGDW